MYSASIPLLNRGVTISSLGDNNFCPSSAKAIQRQILIWPVPRGWVLLDGREHSPTKQMLVLSAVITLITSLWWDWWIDNTSHSLLSCASHGFGWGSPFLCHLDNGCLTPLSIPLPHLSDIHTVLSIWQWNTWARKHVFMFQNNSGNVSTFFPKWLRQLYRYIRHSICLLYCFLCSKH